MNTMYDIFLADDHTIIRHDLRRIIEENPGYRIVAETGDGLQIVPKIRTLHPDMIILDLTGPKLRGIDAVRQIRKYNKKIKILILTMHKNNEYVYECLVNGAQGYMLKEDADSELICAIRALKTGNIYISPSFSNEVIRNLVERRSNTEKKRGSAVRRVLTPRESEVLKLVTEGNSNKKVADKLGISVRTAEHHRLNIMKKLSVTNTADLVRYALRTKVID
ncbi:MAG: response regulator transcription factor [bacterium]